jgi:hypothetical protein
LSRRRLPYLEAATPAYEGHRADGHDGEDDDQGDARGVGTAGDEAKESRTTRQQPLGHRVISAVQVLVLYHDRTCAKSATGKALALLPSFVACSRCSDSGGVAGGRGGRFLRGCWESVPRFLHNLLLVLADGISTMNVFMVVQPY